MTVRHGKRRRLEEIAHVIAMITMIPNALTIRTLIHSNVQHLSRADLVAREGE